MPISKSLHKVSKKLSKQSSGSLHVKGRKFKQLNRATERDIKLKLKKHRFAEQKNHELLYYLFVQEYINEIPDKSSFTIDDMRHIIETYINRNDEELEEFEKERRPGRPMTNKHQIKVEKKKHDEHLFQTGYRIPDLTDVLTVTRLRNWNGTSGSASSWKWKLVSKSDATDATTAENDTEMS
ncbi:hypothetical protein PUMCH_004163 [Australozyma saopauloensis]|uniref:Translation machinery-associated protein 16 n=1 Tax=Australozyma saopauloensis TaxID=291208 RepID=A0AAX4HFZ1_9ASCO|nr:hypothetical protein PUMCH_004163 [[Candida] saopauloensis]